jgi:hypothetical protein
MLCNFKAKNVLVGSLCYVTRYAICNIADLYDQCDNECFWIQTLLYTAPQNGTACWNI